MTSQEIREKFLKFFEKKGHKIAPSSSLVPDDPSVLFTTAGMQQFKPYYTGDADPMRDFGSLNTVSVQKSMRTSDIDEVGDESHLTFFEMLGNFSFGGYFKEDAIKWAHEFITKEMGLEIDYVSVFGGEGEILKDEESEHIWKSINANIKIKYAGREDNFWGPTGTEGPCGPTTEIYVRGTEIWNIVFNEFYCHKDGKMEKLKTPGIDTGMGLERLAMVVQNTPTIFETDLFEFAPLLRGENEDVTRRARIIADHLRASVFLLADGVRPSNKEAGHILRRLLRRLLIHAERFHVRRDRLEYRLEQALKQYGDFYPELIRNRFDIIKEFNKEIDNTETAVRRSLKGLEELSKKFPGMAVQRIIPAAVLRYFNPYIDVKNIAKEIFNLHQTYALPIEDIKEYLKEKFYIFDDKGFDNALAFEIKKHQEISKAGQEKKFGGHGLILDTGELKAGSEEELQKVTKLHTATHLLQAALRKVLGLEVKQMGSDITPERTRFDFSFGRKLTSEELKKVEKEVNDMIKADLNVKMEEMDYEDALKSGALSFFKHKYPKRVKVYTIGEGENVISKEFCGGPHVSRTSEIGGFKIIKEESVAAGTRRVRGALKL